MLDVSIDQRAAARIRQLRAERGFSLETLARRSGVSRSMLSVVERGESSATAALLDKVANGLGVTLASLFDAPQGAAAPEPLSRRERQHEWKDPSSGYLRRNVSPSGSDNPVQLVEIEFPPGARVAFDNNARGFVVRQYVWLLDGRMNVTLGDETYRLRAGDCLAMKLDRPSMFHNPTKKRARYAVVLAPPFGASS
jgi:transcriptional regulator with XRE-family HTH domain